MSEARPESQAGLRPALRLPHATAMVIGTIIGASIFVQPSEMGSLMPSIPALLAAWVLAGLLTIAGSLICAELASALPGTGGVYLFLNRTLSPAAGFLWAWAMFWTMHSGVIAAIAVVFARYVAFFVPLSPSGQRAAGVAAILVLSAINVVGVRAGSRLQAAFTAGKLAAVGCIILCGFAFGTDLPHFIGGQSGWDAWPAFPRAVAAGLFAFGGWHMVTYVGGETVEANRTIPRALMIGAAVVTLCYLALNLVYFYVLPLERVVASSRVAADAADAVLGSGGAAMLSGLVVFSTFGALSGIVLVGPRVYYSLAQESGAFTWLGRVHPRFGTPHRAIAAQAVWASVLVVSGSYRALFSRVVWTEWLFFAAMAVGLFVARRRQDYAPAYRVPGDPIVPAIFILVALAIAIDQLAGNPVEALIGLGLVATGLPAYYFFVLSQRGRRGPS